jgi:hypothetical protein
MGCRKTFEGGVEMQWTGFGITVFFWTIREYLYICYAKFALRISAKGYVRPFLAE